MWVIRYFTTNFNLNLQVPAYWCNIIADIETTTEPGTTEFRPGPVYPPLSELGNTAALILGGSTTGFTNDAVQVFILIPTRRIKLLCLEEEGFYC